MVFQRKLGKITWYVYIYVYRFNPWQLTFHLGTDIPGKMQVQAHHLEGVKGNGVILGYWRYQDEESMVEVLKKIVEIIQNRGNRCFKKIEYTRKNKCL
ncbi:MAG: hypothetical protein ACI4AA_00715 [Lachnospiraceae bacterium]